MVAAIDWFIAMAGELEKTKLYDSPTLVIVIRIVIPTKYLEKTM